MSTIHRSLYRAQCKAEQSTAATARFTAQSMAIQSLVTNGHVLTAALFRWGNHFFAYWESIDQPLSPAALFGDMRDLLESWPGEAKPRTFVPMIDIFHWQAPVDLAHWRRQAPVERPVGRITRLKPAMVSSYIFYHHQLQEEKPGSNDKYGLIALHENLLFFYQEAPTVVEPAPYRGRLTTQNTPDDWHGTMFPHFILWEDAPPGQEIWRQVEVILHQ
ncbi:MAG: hypothetical protein R3C14_03285 [Caldilineaceae bacterium]